MPRVAIIANCQMRPMAALCESIGEAVSVTGGFVVHLAKREDEAAVEAACAKADLVFSQLVLESFPLPFLRSESLRAAHGEKVIVWPNLFFRGQCPDLFYATGTDRLRLTGPLTEYHLASVLEAWRAGDGVDRTVARLSAGDFNIAVDAAQISLDQLRQRETACDVRASDIIEAAWREEHLFFTFNHPRSRLLDTVARRLLAQADVAATGRPASGFSEPLGRIRPPLTPGMCRRFGLEFTDSQAEIRGVPYPGGDGPPITYELPALVAAFFRAYDGQAELAHTARLS
ncbi:WcbI family polysaccharide biosynthesis putative acetyltransferase [Falsiroseomonas sp.]|uniref:WcbI family polysaccharide biosynthesis putative acetyltransferase n=1 Tax=Falsiroseomonas sp. TaxID=2870721 RepID=UPI002724313A|nr:WcbI family polysaccharide biosynthesis putative acetyltransferase [Falsiroseomonas sp.]MDO9502246.1 WcbI family polysaccharide biosynthesis putative acetyltransferase [Falsiroseomonas sp.]